MESVMFSIFSLVFVAGIGLAASKIADWLDNRTTTKAKSRSMREQIFRYLNGCGCEPQKEDECIVFSYRGYRLWIQLRDESKYIGIGASWEKIWGADRCLLLESVNIVNRTVPYVTMFLLDDGEFFATVSSHFHSIAEFKEHFSTYCNYILFAHDKAMETYHELGNSRKSDPRRQQLVS